MQQAGHTDNSLEGQIRGRFLNKERSRMQKIVPFLWFNDQAEQAVDFYTSIFKDSKVINVSRYGEAGPGPKGKVMVETFQLAGQEFTALNGGPEYNFTPAISFFVLCETPSEIDALWEKLSEGGSVLMELDKYPFSEKFGWVADQYGVSWQLSLAGTRQSIDPFLMFVGEQHGKAQEAIKFYTSLFKEANIIRLVPHGPGGEEPEGSVMHAIFSLEGQDFMAMDSSLEHKFTFTEAISFYVNCEGQEEVDYFWEKLSEGGEKGPLKGHGSWRKVLNDGLIPHND
jgi:predicted 3-demethylubiquinone-9 3-methyltransferase (glyoxalase superfamily)